MPSRGKEGEETGSAQGEDIGKSRGGKTQRWYDAAMGYESTGLTRVHRGLR